MPEPIRLLFTGESAGAKAAAEQTTAALDTVKAASAKVNESIVAGSRASIEASLAARKEIEATAARYLESSKEFARGSEQQVEALRLAAAEYKKVGGAAESSAKIAIDAEKVKQGWIERTTMLLRGQAAAQAEAGAAATRSGEERGILGAATKEAGLGRVLGGPAVVGGFIAATAVVGLVKAAQSAQESQRQLANAFVDAHMKLAPYQAAIDKTLKSTEAFAGYSRNELRQAFTEEFRVTGNVTTSQNMLSDAVNLARGRHIDLEAAIKTTIRAEEGNVGALARMGIVIPKVTTNMDALRNAHIKVTDANRAQITALVHQATALDKSATGVEALRALEAKYAGAAEAHSKTLGGIWEDLKNRVLDYAVVVGTKLVPILTKALEWIMKTATAIHDNAAVMKAWNEALHVIGTIIDSVVAGVKLLREGWDALGSKGREIAKIVLAGAAAFVVLNAVIAAAPWVALAAAALIAVTEIKNHWGAISKFFTNLWDDVKSIFDAAMLWLRERAIHAVLDIIEPFSHLPGAMGEWARKMKVNLHEQLSLMISDANVAGASIGTDLGQSMQSAFAPFLASVHNSLSGLGTAAGAAGDPNAKPQAGGTRFGLVNTANALGVRSGAVYAKGGGHGGVAKPGTLLDCSGYTYQVYTQNGFKDFPGTSETQWSTMHGSNWTSEIVSRDTVQPGDLIFSVGSPQYPSPGHVGIVVSGSGASADVMQYYSSGKPADTVKVSDIGDYVGAKRFYLVKQGAKGSTAPSAPSPATSAADAAKKADAAFAAQVAAAKSASPNIPKGPKGLSASSIVTAGASVVAEIKKIADELNDVGLKVTPGELKLEARLQALRDELHKGLGSVETAKVKASMKEVTTALNAEVSDRIKALKKQEAELKKANAAFHSSLTPIKSLLGGILSAGAPGVADSGLASAIGTSVNALTGFGEPIDKTAAALLAKLNGLKAQLAKLSGSGPGAIADRDKIKAEISAWGNALNTELKKQLDRATYLQTQAQTNIDRGWRDLQTTMQRAFDVQTAAQDAAFDKETNATLATMAAQTAQKVAQAVALVKTAYGQFTIGVGGQTPGEAALAALQGSTDATNLQQTLDDAQKELDRQTKLGDPGQIEIAKRAVVAAQTAIAEAALQVQATTERTAADEALAAQQAQIQAEGDAQAQAYSDQRSAAKAAYDQARADQWQHIQDELADWQTMIAAKQTSYAAFLNWYANQKLGSPPSSFGATTAGLPGPAAGQTSGTQVGGVTVNPNTIARGFGAGRALATGGYFKKPFPGLVASHEPEFVIPESWLTPALRDHMQAVLAAHHAPGARALPSAPSGGFAGAHAGAGGRGGDIYVQVDVAGSVTTERELSLAVRDHLVNTGRQSGGNVFGGQA